MGTYAMTAIPVFFCFLSQAVGAARRRVNPSGFTYSVYLVAAGHL